MKFKKRNTINYKKDGLKKVSALELVQVVNSYQLKKKLNRKRSAFERNEC